MVSDPIVEEVRAARQKIFNACNQDLDALLDRFQEHEELDQERVVSGTCRETTSNPGEPGRVHSE
jgi:hypothetical protein